MDQNDQEDFHFFPKLPAELRLIVWRLCLPHRVVEINHPYGHNTAPSPCGESATTMLNMCPPVITRVCRESRFVAYESARYTKLEARPSPGVRMDIVMKTPLWIDYSRDSVHVNWRPRARRYNLDHRPGKPLEYLAWKASQVQGGSFLFDYLGNRKRPHRDNHLHQSLNALDKLQQTPWGAVIMHVIVVHGTREYVAKSGLFGLLCDAPIQVVGVDDEQRLNAFYNLARQCEPFTKSVLPRQNFQRGSADSLRTTLKNRLLQIAFQSSRPLEDNLFDDSFSDESLSDDSLSDDSFHDTLPSRNRFDEQIPAPTRTPPSLHPAIMFRFCPKKCNHSRPSFEEAEAIVKNSNKKEGRPPMSQGRHNYQSFLASLKTARPSRR